MPWLSWQELISFSITRTALNTEQTVLYGPGIIIENNTLSVVSGECFVQLDNIAHVRKGLVATKTNYPLLYIALMSLIALLSLASQLGGAFNRLGSFGFIGYVVFVIAISVAIYIVYSMTTKVSYYGLLVGVNSGTSYSFVSSNDHVVAELYECLKQAINQGSFSGSKTFNLGEGNTYTTSPDANSQRNPTEYGERPTQLPARIDFDPKQLIDELIRTVEEIQYSRELDERQRHFLIGIMMEAKNGIERNSPKDIEQSRIRFRDFAYKTKTSWPRLMASLAARTNLVKFFSTGG